MNPDTFSPTTTKRLEAGTNKTDTCWLWTGAPDKDGYGRLRIGNRLLGKAHRVAYALAYGPFDDSLLVCMESCLVFRVATYCTQAQSPRW